MTDDTTVQQQPDETALSGTVLYDLWLLQQALYPLIENAIRATRLSTVEFGLYLLILEQQPVTPGDIAHQSGMRANTVSTAVQRLERRGHIVRAPNESDGRSVLISLSETGQDVTRQAIEANDALLDRLSVMIDVEAVGAAVRELSRAIHVLANLAVRADGIEGDGVPDRTDSDYSTPLGAVLYDLWLLQQALYPLIENAIRGTGLSTGEFGLYLLILERQPLTPGDIAHQSGMRANTVSTALQRLEYRDHIVRAPNESDRRSVLISLSETGQDVTRQAIEANDALLERLMVTIDHDQVRAAVQELNAAVRILANLPAR